MQGCLWLHLKDVARKAGTLYFLPAKSNNMESCIGEGNASLVWYVWGTFSEKIFDRIVKSASSVNLGLCMPKRVLVSIAVWKDYELRRHAMTVTITRRGPNTDSSQTELYLEAQNSIGSGIGFPWMGTRDGGCGYRLRIFVLVGVR